jgi:hypothetical protein
VGSERRGSGKPRKRQRGPSKAFTRWAPVVEALACIARSPEPVPSKALPAGYERFFGSAIRSPPVPTWLLDEFTHLRLTDNGTRGGADCRPLARSLLNMFAYVLASQAADSAADIYASLATGGRKAALAREHRRRARKDRYIDALETYEHETETAITPGTPASVRNMVAERLGTSPDHLLFILKKRSRERPR